MQVLKVCKGTFEGHFFKLDSSAGEEQHICGVHLDGAGRCGAAASGSTPQEEPRARLPLEPAAESPAGEVQAAAVEGGDGSHEGLDGGDRISLHAYAPVLTQMHP